MKLKSYLKPVDHMARSEVSHIISRAIPFNERRPIYDKQLKIMWLVDEQISDIIFWDMKNEISKV